jgi:hypothetical protein
MPDHPAGAPEAAIAAAAAADLQDHLMVASHDLERLQRLLDDAAQALMQHFYGADHHIRSVMGGDAAPALPPHGAQAMASVMEHLGSAVIALQFQDMATQLSAHTNSRLRNCVDRLARDAFPLDEDEPAVVEAAPLRPNPVTQDEMDAGSVELF